tara:strand:- start:3230 stop:4138 length:909 start_codon:yes stop_codon:yes gene_type:complete
MSVVIFPGQGSQFVGMSKDFYDNFNIARKTLDQIEQVVNYDLKNILFEDNNFLNFTEYTQISIFAASMMIYETIINETNLLSSNINYMLGHSLGEYTALACSKKLSLEITSNLLNLRGKYMSEAVEKNKTGMAALIGQDASKIENIILKNNLKLQIANDNSPIQVVISGNIDDILESKELFLSNDVKKFVKLNVSAAFHSKYMIDAQTKLNFELNHIKLVKNNIKIISNFNSIASNNNEELIYALKNQMASRVKWTDSIRLLEKNGEKNIIEIGPGKVLSGLIKRISNQFVIKSINKIEDLN